jgi:exopolysaccharide biosynthesis polyprenyl glycosylphosphotransferase
VSHGAPDEREEVVFDDLWTRTQVRTPHLRAVTDAAVPVPEGNRAAARLLALLVPFLDLTALVVAAVLAGAGGAISALYVAGALAVGAAQSAYRPRLAPSLEEALPRILAQCAIPLLLVAPLAASGSLTDIALLAPISVGLVVVGRAIGYHVGRTVRRRGLVTERTLIVGAGGQGVSLAETLREHSEYGLVPVGFLDSFEDRLDPPIVGDVGELESVLADLAIDRVIVAYGGTKEPKMVDVLRACDHQRVEVYVVPRFFELGVAPSTPDTEYVWGIPLVRLRRAALRRHARVTKRAFDVVVGSVALVLLAPVMLVAGLAVRFTSPGPLLFRQRRISEGGQEIDVLKLRTMPENDDSETTWNVDDDERLTKTGKVLRKTSLDEVPQLVNVLRGEMSIAGPRPERPHFVDQFDAEVPRYFDRHRLPAGMTGWAQVHGLRGDTSIAERARFDNSYIEHWSLWRDVVIVMRTIAAMWQRNP